MGREDVYKLIDKEREYQNKRWPEDNRVTSDKDKSVSEWIIYLEYILDNAKRCVYFLNEKDFIDPLQLREDYLIMGNYYNFYT